VKETLASSGSQGSSLFAAWSGTNFGGCNRGLGAASGKPIEALLQEKPVYER